MQKGYYDTPPAYPGLYSQPAGGGFGYDAVQGYGMPYRDAVSQGTGAGHDYSGYYNSCMQPLPGQAVTSAPPQAADKFYQWMPDDGAECKEIKTEMQQMLSGKYRLKVKQTTAISTLQLCIDTHVKLESWKCCQFYMNCGACPFVSL